MPADSTIRDRGYFAGRWLTRQVGRATASLRTEPAFIIAGAQRCGTTSLYKTLCQHPGVVPAVLHKGVHYFDTGAERDFAWYLGHFPTKRTLARRSFAGHEAITGESSPYYLFHPHAAARIAAALPDVRVLVLVRDPVERAYSAHSHETARGYETRPFVQAIELERERTETEWARMVGDPSYSSFEVQHHSYIARGHYSVQLERMSRALGRERIHVIDSGRFYTTPEQEMPRILEFLRLAPFSDFAFGKHNARGRSPMPSDLEVELSRLFEPSDAELTGWLGHVPSWRQ